MYKVSDKLKVKLLERLVRALTTADEIRYKLMAKPRSRPRSTGFGYITLVGSDPEDFEWHDWIDEGLHLDWCAEVYKEDYDGLIKPETRARVNAEIWFSMDVWKEYKKLEEENKELKSKIVEQMGKEAGKALLKRVKESLSQTLED